MSAFGDLPRHTSTDAALRDLRDPDPRVRVAAASALDRAPAERREEVCRALRDALCDGRGDVRYAAALSLRALEDRRAVGQLIEMLHDRDGHARQAAAIALGHLGDRAAVAPLIDALRDGPPDLRFQAIPSLTELGDRTAIPAILQALSDTDREVRANAAAALGDFGAADASDSLAELLADPDETVSFEAAYSLARLSDARAISPLARFATHRDFGSLACASLGRLLALGLGGSEDQERGRAALRKAARRRLGPPLCRLEAAAALVRLGEEAARPHLVKATRSRRQEVRGLALERLGEVGGPQALEVLTAALSGRSPDAAARGLRALGEVAALGPLQQALEAAGADEELRQEVEAAIAHLGQGAQEGASK